MGCGNLVTQNAVFGKPWPMRTPRPLPEALAGRAFSTREAREAGVSARMLEHDRFIQVFPRVYAERGTQFDELTWIDAAAKSMPTDAKLSHASRIRLEGVSVGRPRLVHFTVARDLHRDVPNIFLHRTDRMPPADRLGVTVESAFLGVIAHESLAEAVKAGDWLLRTGRLRLTHFKHLLLRDPWRAGVGAAPRVLELLDSGSESPQESLTRLTIAASGLPVPECNIDICAEAGFVARGDLVYREFKIIIEYEGRQHAFDVEQFNRDIHRYAALEAAGWLVVRVTKEMLDHPHTLVATIHRALCSRGYRGPRPAPTSLWHALHRPARSA